MKTTRKTLAVLLAILLCLSFAGTALASEQEAGSNAPPSTPQDALDTAVYYAASITEIEAPAKDATMLDLPALPQGYTVSITSSGSPDVIAVDGTITPPPMDTAVTVRLIVIKTSDGTWAETQEIPVTVPARTPTAAEVAAGITGIEPIAQDEMKIILPEVPEGYGIEISHTSAPDIIALDGTLRPGKEAQSVSLIFTVTRVSDGTQADTAEIEVQVPAEDPPGMDAMRTPLTMTAAAYEGDLDLAGAEQTILGAINWAKAGNQYVLNDTFLTMAGTTPGDWFPIGIGRYGYPDRYNAYLQAVAANITSRYAAAGKLHSSKATEWHRISLAVLAMGGDPTAIGQDTGGNPVNLIADGTYNSLVDPISKQGINGPIWGLIALDSKQYTVPGGAKYSRDELIKMILLRQKSNGGFSLSDDDTGSDPDITAMAVQALAPYYNSTQRYTYTRQSNAGTVSRTVKEVVDECIAWLSSVQRTDGDFGSWGTVNAESTAQVIVALCSLGINPNTDARFIKNGYSVIDGLMKYKNEADGGFYHSFVTDPSNPSADPTQSNSMATEQSLYALVSYWRYLSNMRNLYDFRPETDQSKFTVECEGQEYVIPFNPATPAYDLELPQGAVTCSFTNIPAGPYDSPDIQTGASVPIQDGGQIQVNITRRDGSVQNYTLQIALTEMAAINNLIGRIAALPSVITLADEETVEELLGIYDGLSEQSKDTVTNIDVLLAAKETIDELNEQKEQEKLAHEQEIREGVASLPDPLSIDDKAKVNSLLAELAEMDDFDGKAGLIATLSSCLHRISELEVLVAQLDQDIWDRIQPRNITMADSDTVAALMARYNALNEKDRAHVIYADDLLLADEIIAGLKQGTIIKQVFMLMLGEDRDYSISGVVGGVWPYTVTFNGKNIRQTIDFDGRIYFSAANKAKIDAFASDPYYIRFAHAGYFPGVANVTMKVNLPDDGYLLYYYNAGSGKAEFVKRVTLSGGRFSFSANRGGDYFLTQKSLLEGVRSVDQSDFEQGRVGADAFEEIMGQNVNLKINCTAADGRAYSITFNGTDITDPMDFDTDLSFSSEHDEEIELLADPPYFVISFAHSGSLPGPMMVETEVDLEDGEYLLFYYNPDTMKAEYVQKVTVEYGRARFILKHLSDYFIARRARAASAEEIRAEMEEEEKEVQAAQNPAEPEAAVKAPPEAEPQATVAAVSEATEQEEAIPITALICILAAVVAAVIAVYMIQKEKIKESNLDDGQVK